MNVTRSIKTTLIAALAACALAASVGVTSAQASEPWWHMSVTSRPSTIGGAQNEEQLVTVSATGGYFYLEDAANGQRDILPPLPFDASHQEVQTALEGIYGAGNVEVPKGDGNAEGTEPYEVIFIGKRGYQSVPLVAKSFPCSCLGYESLHGGKAEVTVTTKTAGRPAGKIVLLASNLGDAAAEGATQPITISDTLPPELEAIGIQAKTANTSVNRGAVSCTEATLTCEFSGELPAYEAIEVEIAVNVRGRATSKEVDTATVEGGGAAPASGSLSLAYGGEPSFGVQDYHMSPEREGGGAVTQAGEHSFQMTTTTILNQDFEGAPISMVKDLEFQLPPGLVGNPTAMPQCSLGEFMNVIKEPLTDECRQETAVGVAVVTIRLKGQIETFAVPVFNLEPEKGEPARFGFYPAVPVVLDTAVRTGKDYGVTVSSHNIAQIAGFLSAQVTLWGVPGNPRHDEERGWACLKATQDETGFTCKPEEDRNPPPFLSMPPSCSGTPLESTVEGDSWQRVDFEPVSAMMPALVGCNKERFEPTIRTTTDYEEASRPSGLSVDVHVPQQLQTVAEGTAESEVKQIEVALPKGVTVNPGGAGGLQACTGDAADAPGTPGNEIGFKGANSEAVGGLEYTPSFPSCPKQSKIATVTIHTPLLPNPLEGAVYLAKPDSLGAAELGDNPFNSLIAMYLVAEDPVSGTLVKLPMHVSLNESTGQITTVVENPQLPFEDAELHFFGGGRAPLATPGLCGSYTTKAVFTPWSGQEPVTSTSTFEIKSGPNGSPCPSNPRPFTPEFNAGTINGQAASYSELRTTMGHPDVDQPLAALRMTLPPGLSGMLSHVKLCGEPQAREGVCGPESLIGHTVVTAGLGSTPAVVARPGNVYITGPYDGAPYGLSVANPAETGPFDLDRGTACDCTVVRAKVEINPHTAQITVTTPPSGGEGAIPTMLKGIPLDLQHISVQIDRPQFTFNPTSCEPLKITGSISGGEGGTSPISEPFQVANCATLPFHPSFKVYTRARHTRRNGAYLHVVVESKQGQAGLREVHVELPKALPSRLPTLQKACTEAQFAKNPAGCPAVSVVGHAVIHTPVLPVPLTGPAYFVSHGGAKFPELIMVLQGYGTTIYLNGETFIDKKSITSSTFPSTPDVPFNRFDLTLPAGPHSALAGFGDFCARPLYMPTRMLAQSGKLLEHKTRIVVEGCKPEIHVLGHHVKGSNATIRVQVPSAGTLTAGGNAIRSAVKRARKAGVITIRVSLSRHDRRVLARNPHERVNAKIKLRFTPRHGKPLTAGVKLLMG